MKLYFWDDPTFPRNFGDQLNLWLWLQLLPGMMDEDSNEIFVGVGSILNSRIPEADRIVVMGSGIGYGTPPTPDERWTFYAVRGPVTASALDLPAETAVVDPGVLVGEIFGKHPVSKSDRAAFMPHWRSRSEDWPAICEKLGIDYIDPLSAVPDVIADIRSAKFLLTEAMHGAIAADALRVPWVPLWSEENVDGFRLKWEDWCGSVDMEFDPQLLPESPARTESRRWKRIVTRVAEEVYPYPKRRKMRRVTDYMDQILRQASPILSDETVLRNRIATLQDRIERFRMEHS